MAHFGHAVQDTDLERKGLAEGADVVGKSDSAKEPSIADIIENLGFGLAQLRVTLTGGAIWIADGAELLLITSAADSVSQEWKLGQLQRGSMITIVFAGVFLGNFFGGSLGDTYGRRFPILLSFFLITMFSILSSFAWSFWTLSIMRLLVGMSFGIGQPSEMALLAETTPTKWRIVTTAFTYIMFCFGEIYSGFLLLADDPNMTSVDWRWLMRMGAIPSVIFGILTWFLTFQSPFWLSSVGRHDDAKLVLQDMRAANGALDVSVDFRRSAHSVSVAKPEEAVRRQYKIVFGEMLLPTICMCYSTFNLNLVYYGGLYGFAQVLPDMNTGASPAVELIIGALLEIPGYLLGMVCGLMMNRKNATWLYLIFTIASLAMFAMFAPNNQETAPKMVMYIGYYGVKIFPGIGWSVVYLHAIELYPTAARATGAAVCFAGGRVGAMAGSLLFESILKVSGDFRTFYNMLIVFCVLNFLAVKALPIDTAGMQMEEQEVAKREPEAALLDAPSESYGSVRSA